MRHLLISHLLVASVVAAQDTPGPVLPKPTGPYRVGVTRQMWTDTSRGEIGTPDTTDRRIIIGRIWYPTQADTGRAAPYLPQLEAYVAAGSVTQRAAALLRSVKHASLQEAPPPRGNARLPVALPGREDAVLRQRAHVH